MALAQKMGRSWPYVSFSSVLDTLSLSCSLAGISLKLSGILFKLCLPKERIWEGGCF